MFIVGSTEREREREREREEGVRLVDQSLHSFSSFLVPIHTVYTFHIHF